jgi:hypothetical protein
LESRGQITDITTWVRCRAGVAEPPEPRLPHLIYKWAIVVALVMFLCCAAGVAYAYYVISHTCMDDCPLRNQPPPPTCYTSSPAMVSCLVYRSEAP